VFWFSLVLETPISRCANATVSEKLTHISSTAKNPVFWFLLIQTGPSQRTFQKMVVIKQEESEHRNASPSNAAGAVNDASDGFETASEADLDSDDDSGDGGADRHEEKNHPEKQHQQQQTEQQPEHDVSQSTAESSENALITEESSENAVITEESSENALIKEEESRQVVMF